MKYFAIAAIVGLVFEAGWSFGCMGRLEKSTVKIMLQTAYIVGQTDQIREDGGLARRYKNAEDYSNHETLVK